MTGETQLSTLIKNMSPQLNDGEYVFVSVDNLDKIDRKISLCEFKEAEGTTVILEKNRADALNLSYDYVAAWITLTVHSALEAVGLTARFSTELANHNISCNVVAGYYHDHIFVDKSAAEKALNALKTLAENAKNEKEKRL